MSVTCATNWTGRSGATRSRPSAAAATGWRPTVAEPRRRSKVRARSIRVRTTGLAVVVVGLAMAVGMAILVHVFRESLLGELEVSARLHAGELAEDVAGGRDLRAVHTEDLVVQLVDRDGRIIASTPNAAG